MKKILSLLFSLVMILSVFAGCGASGQTETGTKEENDASSPSETAYETVGDVTLDKRKVVYEYMKAMSEVVWTPEQTLDLSKINSQLVFKKGVTYTGMPYVTAIAGTLEQFLAHTEDGVYKGPFTVQEAIGNHCSSSIINSWKRVSDTITAGYTVNMMPQREKGTVPVGDYVFERTDTSTEQIVKRNKSAVIFDAYSKLQMGDAVLSAGTSGQWNDTGHTRMVISVDVSRKANGEINPNRSSVTTIEQTNAFDKTAKGINTTYWVNHVYSFTDLFSKNYIPVTVKELNEPIPEPDISIQSPNTPKNISRGKLNGWISTNIRMFGVKAEITDKDGNVAVEQYIDVPADKRYSFSLGETPLPDSFKELAAGRYFFKMTLKLSYGDYELVGFYFDVTEKK